LRENPVAEIEDVARRGTEAFKDLARSCAHTFRRREQRHRIEISLKRDAACG
jgi:hypothetical protein